MAFDGNKNNDRQTTEILVKKPQRAPKLKARVKGLDEDEVENDEELDEQAHKLTRRHEVRTRLRY